MVKINELHNLFKYLNMVRVFGTGVIMSFGMGIMVCPYHMKYYFRYRLLIYSGLNMVWGIWYGRSKYPFQIWFRTGTPPYIYKGVPFKSYQMRGAK